MGEYHSFSFWYADLHPVFLAGLRAYVGSTKYNKKITRNHSMNNTLVQVNGTKFVNCDHESVTIQHDIAQKVFCYTFIITS